MVFLHGCVVASYSYEVQSRSPEDAKSRLQPIILMYKCQWSVETSVLLLLIHGLQSVYTVTCSSTASKHWQIHRFIRFWDAPNSPCVRAMQPRGTWLYYEIGSWSLAILELSLSVWDLRFSPSKRAPLRLPTKRERERYYKTWRSSCFAQCTRPHLPLQDLKQNSLESRIKASEFSFWLSKWKS